MNKDAKITVSADELAILQDRSFFGKKKSITAKIYQQFAQVIGEANAQQVFSSVIFPAGTDFTTGKISKGENYKGLPFLLLDFPRLFGANEILAVRTMVWWGNFISSTFLISGERLPACRNAVLKNLSRLTAMQTWICVNDSPWHHDFEIENYVMMKNLNRKQVAEILENKPFMKLGRKIPVSRINGLTSFSMESFRIYSRLMG